MEQPPINGTPCSDSEIIEERASSVTSGEISDDPSLLGSASRSSTSRELKSILALSKEAKLDTNISSQRRSKGATTPKQRPKIGTPPTTAFPVTAESELETGVSTSTPTMRKKEEGVDGEIKETRRRESDITDYFVMARKPNKDIFCWRCHHDCVQVACEICPRAYHLRCLKQTVSDKEHWPCPECVTILKAESTQTRSKAMKGMTLEHLCSLLKFAAKRMLQCNGSDPFVHAVDENQFPEYRNYIVQPMTLNLLEKQIKENAYGSTQAFEADAKWILHNSIIFNSSFPDQSKLTTAAKAIVKICKQEMAEIENCPSCYLNANTKKNTWFVEVCPKPHILVWAKLKGFPYWPAKVMSVNSSGMADVRFFGAHDKAWVSVKDCYLYSSKDPNSGKQKRNDIIECVKELELYVDNLRLIYGRVVFAPFKTPLEPDPLLRQLSVILPNFKDEGKEVMGVEMGLKKSKIEKALKANGGEVEEKEEEEDAEDDLEEEEDEESGESSGEEYEQEEDDEEEPEGFIRRQKMTRVDYTDKFLPKNSPKLDKSVNRKDISSDRIKDTSASILINDEIEKVNEEKDETMKNDNEKNEPVSGSSPAKRRISDELIKKLDDFNEEGTGKKNEDDEKVKEVNEVEKQTEEKMDTDDVLIQSVIESVKEDENKTQCDEEKQDEPEKKVEEQEKEKVDNVIEESIIVNEVPPEKGNLESEDTNKKEVVQEDKQQIEKDVPKASTSKRKLSNLQEHDKDDPTIFPPNKMVKLVPIENILKRKESPPPQRLTSSNKTEQLIVLKEVRVVKDGKEIKNKSKKPTTSPEKKMDSESVKIKREIESDDDNDVQYMEAKRQYLSALNISEKQKIPSKPKHHEIRTRSKTEEKKSKREELATHKNLDNGQKEGQVKEIYVKSLSKMQMPKHKARKSFPTPNYGKKTIVARKLVPKSNMGDDLTIVNSSTLQPTGNVMILPKLHYNKPQQAGASARDLSSPPVLALLSRPSQVDTTPKKNVVHSQNYIPQHEEETGSNSNSIIASTTGSILRNNLSGTVATSANLQQTPIIDLDNIGGNSSSNANTSSSGGMDIDLGPLKDVVPESVAKGITDILCQPPPKLRPKPVGLLNNASNLEGGIPSTAGPIAARVNSMAQKLSDYFRSLLVETISDIGRSNNPEGTISSLKYEIEELNHKHSIELSEIRRNVSIVLKDIQKSVIEEKERIVNETKANCEIEMTKKIEEAKSKQWCANCLKEAQFYCCWNTSYCDYPCQQKHWPKHMNKCTQNANQSQCNNVTPVRSTAQQLVLTPTVAPKLGSLFAKPQKVYLKRTTAPFKANTGGGNHITLVESTPGNFELLGSGPIAVNGKILASTSVIEKIKSGNIVTVSAPSGVPSTQLVSTTNQRTVTTVTTTKNSASEH